MSGMRRLAQFLVALVVVATSCSPGQSDPTTLPPTPHAWGEGRPSADLILRVDIDGGLTTFDYVRAFPPRASIYADGTVYFLGGANPDFLPLLKTITSAQLDAAQLAQVTSLIEAMGLREITDNVDRSLSPSSGGDTWVIDGATTTATYFDRDGGTHSYGVYALGPGHETPEAVALSMLVTDLNNMTAAATDLVDLPADRLQLHWRRQRSFDAARPSSAEALPWPLTIDPQDFIKDHEGVRCTVLTGQAALEAAEKLITVQWESIFAHDDKGYRLIGRVLLPGEEGCVEA